MSTNIIKANPTFKKIKVDLKVPYINIAEMFADTIQGENFMGWPATFIRLQKCTLDCVFCDSNEVWREGNPYSIEEIFELWEEVDLIRKFREGQHLVLTGGSPLLQQKGLVDLIRKFINKYGFKPYIEIENECTLFPLPEMEVFVDLWNNSPKLANSEMSEGRRYQPEVLKRLSSLKNSWFKFVITKESEWDEIIRDFIKPGLIKKEQIVLMPEGQTREELEMTRGLTLELSIKHSVRFSDRLHIIYWNKKTGV